MMNRLEKQILTVTCFGHFMSHFNVIVFPALVLPLAARLHLEMAPVLAISFWMYLFFGITALPWGMVADRWGAKPLMLLFYAGCGLSGLAAAHWTDSPAGLTVALAFLGLFSGIYHPAGLGLISKEMVHIGLGMGYNGMFGNLGLTMAPLLTGLVNWVWGPAAVYLFLGCLNLAGVVIMFALPISESGRERRTDSGQNNGFLGAFVILLAAMMLGGFVYRGATVILPAYFELNTQGILQTLSRWAGKDISANLVAASATSFIFFVGILGQYLGGRVAERFEPRFSYFTFHAVTIPIAFLMAAAWNLPLIVLALTYFFFLLGMQPIENTLVTRFTPKRFRHSAFGAKFVLTFGVGALAVKMVEGIESGWGIGFIFPTLGVISLGLVSVIFLLIRKTPRFEASVEGAPNRPDQLVSIQKLKLDTSAFSDQK